MDCKDSNNQQTSFPSLARQAAQSSSLAAQPSESRSTDHKSFAAVPMPHQAQKSVDRQQCPCLMEQQQSAARKVVLTTPRQVSQHLDRQQHPYLIVVSVLLLLSDSTHCQAVR